MDHALGLPALYSCVRLLSESLASLPIKIYTRAPGGSSAVRYTGPSIFDKPSVSANTYDWVYQCMTSLLLHGNAWGFITGRDGFGYPTGVDWIAPDMVNVMDDEQQPWNPLRTRVYVYGRLISNWRDELFHIRAFTIPGRTEGISPLRAFINTVASGLESQQYGNDWFASGGFPTGVFQNCVDTETEILTRDGWRHHDEIRRGDEVLTLNTETGQSEWQPLTRVYVNEGPNPVIRMKNSSHSSVSTPNHRWPVLTRGDYDKGLSQYTWYHTDQLAADDRICAAAPVVPPVEAKWSDAMAELMAWFSTEGSICYTGRGQGGHVVIGQSRTKNPDKVLRIRVALNEVFGTPTSPSESMRHGRSRPQWQERRYPAQYKGQPYEMVTFHLNQAAGRVLTAIAPDKVVSTRFLSELTRAQLELFISTAIDGDGCRSGGAITFAQTDVRRTEAFQVACALAGKSGDIRGGTSGQHAMTVKTSAWRKPHARSEYVTSDVIDEKVWCPVTPNKTWYARRDGTCYFTGNTQLEVDAASDSAPRNRTADPPSSPLRPA